MVVKFYPGSVDARVAQVDAKVNILCADADLYIAEHLACVDKHIEPLYTRDETKIAMLQRCCFETDLLGPF